MKFIKLQYKDVIKKILLTKEELTWDHLCDIIMSSFSFPDREKIILKYMDLEKEEISVTNDEELSSALSLYFLQKFIKFFVHYSEQNKEKIGSKEKIKEQNAEHSEIKNENENLSCEKNEEKKQNALNTSLNATVQTDEKLLVLNHNEIQEIFSVAFEEAKVFTYIQKGLLELAKKKIDIENIEDLSNLTVEYGLQSDSIELAEYFKTVLNSALKTKFIEEKHEENINENPSLEKNLSKTTKMPKIEITQKITNNQPENQMDKEEFKNDGESLIESVYELVENIESDSSFLTNPQCFLSPLKRETSLEREKDSKFMISGVKHKQKLNLNSKLPLNLDFTRKRSYYEDDLNIPQTNFHKSISDISFDFMSMKKTLHNQSKIKFHENTNEANESILKNQNLYKDYN